MNKFKVKL